MKRILAFILAAAMCFSLASTAFATEAAAARSAAAAPSGSSTGRESVSLNGAWLFTDPDADAAETVSVPHSWDCFKSAYNLAANVKTCTYEREIDVSRYAGKKLFLEFQGVNKIARVSVDGEEVGSHTGGFSTFWVDITEACAGKTAVTVSVDVTNMSFDTMPVNSDFTHFAGIYRDVNLVAVEKTVSVSNQDGGSSGVYMRTDVDLSSGAATLSPVVMLDYDYAGVSVYDTAEVTVRAALYDAAGAEVGCVSRTLALQGRETAFEVALDTITVEDAHLWNGTVDPYLYTAEVTVLLDGLEMDRAAAKVGFRVYEIKDGAFYLNGAEYELRGVGMHQEYGAATNATTDAQKYADILTVLEMGANALRTCHYPHDQYVYDLCDEYGIVVWCEIPFYLVMLNTEEFRSNVLQSLREMIKQGFNHPSIVAWGISNEVNVYAAYQAFYPTQANTEELGAFMQELARLTHELDPSRLAGEAEIDNTAYSQETAGWTTADSGIDVVGFNIYTGWYSNVNGATLANQTDRIVTSFRNKLATYQSRFDAASEGTVSYVLTEYGAGANIDQHDDLGEDFVWGGSSSKYEYYTSGQYHPEEYQSYVHEGMMMAIYGDETNGIKAAENLWGAFSWAMFDFSCYRNEGGTTRLNTKGLVTADRTVKKDAFYLYKANWNETDPFVHICSSRYCERTEQRIDVKAYSNCDSVELLVNGVSYGEGALQQDGVFVWKDVRLNELNETNTVRAVGKIDGKTVYTDTCDSWVYVSNTEIVATDALDKEYDGEAVEMPAYTVRVDGVDQTRTVEAAGAVQVSWYQLLAVSGSDSGDWSDSGDYPAYGPDAVKYVLLDGRPLETGYYACVISVDAGADGELVWGSARHEIRFRIEHTAHLWDDGVVTLPATCDTDGVMTYTCTACGETETRILPAGHDYRTSTVEPSCLGYGYTVNRCTRCGYSYVSDITQPLGHEYRVEVTEPTCKSAGYTTHTCAVCGESYVDAMAEATGHSYKAVTTAPTCDEMGYTTHTCTVCGDSYVDAFVSATEHNYEQKRTKEPTCTAEGEMRFTCGDCGKSYTQTLPKAEHDCGDTVMEPTCRDYGYTVHACRNCDYSYISNITQPLGHEYRAEVTEPTCKSVGYTTYTCAVCGDSYTDAITENAGHSYEAVTTAPTCDEMGYTTHTCTVCGDSYVDAFVSATEHNYEQKCTKEPTCTAEGEMRFTCGDCGKSYTQTLPKAEHDCGDTVMEPTCRDYGYTVHACRNCDYSYISNITQPLGHQYELAVTAPTCGQMGYTTHTCTVCGESYVDTMVAAMGHSYEAVVTVPTCGEMGYTTHTCTVCGESYVDTMVAATGHSYEAVVTAPTCGEMGYTTHTCTVCGESYVDTVVAATGHSYEAVTTAPTCDEMGYTVHTCTVCGDSYIDAFVPATDHDYRQEITKAPTCTEEGELTFLCRHDGCGRTYTQTLPKAEHDCGTTVVEPSCLGYGYTAYQCANCGYRYIAELREPLGHKYSAAVTEPTLEEGGYTRHTCERCGEYYVDSYTEALGHKCAAFTDINGHWAREAICFVVERELFQGVTETLFSPNGVMTRAMTVTVLYRLAGEPEVSGETAFTDVNRAGYYYKALLWATQNGIVKGITETVFAPGDSVTREQLVTFLYRYARLKGLDVTIQADLSGYADDESVHTYAREAFAWAVGTGLVKGVDERTLSPRTTATRAQLATILMRLAVMH